MDKPILRNEIEWHQRHVVSAVDVGPITADEIAKYRECPNWRFNSKQFMFKSMGPLSKKLVLDFGSGDGINAVEMALLGANVVGFDLCPGLVEESRARAKVNNVTDTCSFDVGEASTFPIKPNSYDVVLIDNVMHHIPEEDHVNIYEKVAAGMKVGGMAIVREPVCFSWLIDVIKRIVPYEEHASPDERELSRADIECMLSNFPNHEVRFFQLFSRAARLLRISNLESFGMRLDRAVFGVPALRSSSRTDRRRRNATLVTPGYGRDRCAQ